MASKSTDEIMAVIYAEIAKRLDKGAGILKQAIIDISSKPSIGRATPGAPMRRKTGAFHRSLQIEREGGIRELGRRVAGFFTGAPAIKVRITTGVLTYPRYHETHEHPTFAPALTRCRSQLEAAVGGVES